LRTIGPAPSVNHRRSVSPSGRPGDLAVFLGETPAARYPGDVTPFHAMADATDPRA
jgi:hypothetical protein